ncbi:putative RING-type domain-containing protein [Seiridium cardinale]
MATCKVCDEPLLLEVEDEEGSGQPQSIPDDLELSCACHFHWQCLLDQASEVALSLECPSCHRQIATNPAGPSVTNHFRHANSGSSILTRYHNEGGLQEDLDILPEITEEAYLEANPEARPARAYHVMCSEGDASGIVELLRDIDQSAGQAPSLSPAQLLRYQDPLSSSKSGLHLAVERGQEEVAWLLLWVASSLSTDVFPAAAVNAAQMMGVPRPATTPAEDIRLLQDGNGRTAESIAAEMNGIWTAVLEAGAFHPGT